MRILFCLHNYHPAKGGAEWLMQNVAERLAARGHQATVLATNAWSVEDYFLSVRGRKMISPTVEDVNGVRVKRVPFSRFGARFLVLGRAAANRLPVPGANALRMLSWGPRSRAYARAAAEEAAEADLVVACPLPTLNVRYAVCAARRLRRPLVIVPCFHTEDRHTYHHPMYYRWLRSAEAVASLTEHEKNFLKKEGRIAAGKIFITGAGIEPGSDARGGSSDVRARYGIPPGECVLFVGQHGRHKGIPDLVRAMSLVWEEGGEASLVIAGNPTDHTRQVKKLVANMEPQKRRKIFFIEQFPEEEKRGLYRLASVFVSVSPFESFGIVFLEAWRERRPVIGCVRGASSKVIKAFQDGLLVEPEKPRELAGAILALLRDPAARQKMGERGRKKVEDLYAWDRVMEKWENVFIRAVSRST